MKDNKEIKRYKSEVYFNNCKITISNFDPHEEDISMYVEDVTLKIIRREEIKYILLEGWRDRKFERGTKMPTQFIISGELK